MSESVCEEGPGICSHLLTLISLLIILVTLPFSLCCVVQVVQVRVVFLSSHLLNVLTRGMGGFDKAAFYESFFVLKVVKFDCWLPRRGCFPKSEVTAEGPGSFVFCSHWKLSANVKMINGYKYVSPSYFYKCFRKVFVSIILNIWSKPAKSILCYEETILSYCYWSNLSISIEKVKFYDKFQSHKSKWLKLIF